MRKPVWVLAAFAFTAAVATCGCQPATTGGAAGSPSGSAQLTSNTPEGMETAVLIAKGMH